MIVTPELLMAATECARDAALIYAGALMASAQEYGITTADQLAMFIAQTAYETRRYTLFAEDMDYRRPETLMRVWPSRFPSREFAVQYIDAPEKLANYVYCNRNGNGAIASGDGFRFRGAGALMLTGRTNFEAFERASALRVTTDPTLLQKPAGAFRSAGWFWQRNGFNALADAGDFKTMTRRLNGSLTGYDDGAPDGLNDRVEYLAATRAAIANQGATA